MLSEIYILSDNVNILLYRYLISRLLYYSPFFFRLISSREKRASFLPEKAIILKDERISVTASRRKKKSYLYRIIASRIDFYYKVIVREIKIIREF